MATIYERLLDEIVRRGFPTGVPVVRISRPLRGWLALRRFLACRLVAAGDPRPSTENGQ